MSRRFVPVLLVLGLLLAPLRAAEPKIRRTPVAPETGLTTYYVGLLTKGAHAGEGTREDREQTQKAQNAYINRLASEGKLLVAGPIADKGDWRGIYIYKCASLAEAQALAAADPEVMSGRLRIEVHPWITEKGSIRDPEFRAAN
jgi:uncharacterized protein YciI